MAEGPQDSPATGWRHGLTTLAYIALFLSPLILLQLAIEFTPPPDPYKDKSMLRNHIPPRFHPLRNPDSFVCRREADAVPPIDPQADAWLQQALALEDVDIPLDTWDYKRIIELTQAAAGRKHWQAMLNLINLRLEDRGKPWGILPNDREQAVRELEAAMALGIPAAYEMMGRFYQDGIGVPGDISAAYTFYQMAAEMGEPRAMTFLGTRLLLSKPNPEFPGRWANRPLARKMYECAFSQGYGQAAYELHFMQHMDTYSAEDKALAMRTLHEGVKMGSAECAGLLRSQFDGTYLGHKDSFVTAADKARAERYWEIRKYLGWYGPRFKMPNLDKVLPLPPAELPYWDGNRDTLIDAARGVITLPPPPKPHPGTAKTGRAHVPEGHTLGEPRHSLQGHNSKANADGYWQPRVPEMFAFGNAAFVNQIDPQVYARGQLLESHVELVPGTRWQYMSRPELDSINWQYLGEAVPIQSRAEPLLVRLGLARSAEPAEAPKCNGLRLCPKTGIWMASVAAEHPLARSFNRWDRQAYVQEGGSFPDPTTSHLEIDARDVRWTFLGEANRVGTNGLVQVTLG